MEKKFVKLFSRDYGVQYVESYTNSLGRKYKAFLPAVVEGFVVMPEHSNQVTYAPEAAWQFFLGRLENLTKQKSFLNNFAKNFYRAGKNYVFTSQSLGKLNLRKLNNIELAKCYERYIEQQEFYNIYLWLGNYIGECLVAGCQSVLSKKNLDLKSLKTVEGSLYQPSKKCGVLNLQQELIPFKRRSLKYLPKSTATKLLKKYLWISCLDIHCNPWSIADIENFYKDFQIPLAPINFKAAIRLCGLTAKEIRQFEVMREFLYIKDMRDVYRRQAVYMSNVLFEEIARRLKLKRKLVSFCTHEEIAHYLKRGLFFDLRLPQKRANGYLFYDTGRKPTVVTDKKLIKQFRARLKRTEVSNAEVKGMAASRGQARGKVRLVHNVSESRSVKKGEVMVAVSTHPDFVPAMQKAGAITTDEGAINSHAAIVSRELGIPCIVGTKIATKVFKDGDLVEVDANKGIVRKITK